MKTWEIVLLKFPFTDGTSAKVRPAVVVSKPHYHDHGQDGLFLLVTGNTSRQSDYDVLVDDKHPEFRGTGFLRSSCIRIDKVMNLNKALVSRVLGRLGPNLQNEVRAKLRDLWNI